MSSASSVAQDDDVLKALQQMTIRAIAAEAKNELYEGRLSDKEQIIEAWKGRAGIAEKQLAKSQENRSDAEKVFTGDARMLEAANGIIAKQDAEIARLRNPSFLGALFDKRTAYGGIVGFGLCKLTNGGISNPFQLSSLYQVGVVSAEERAKQALRLFTK